MYKYIAIEGNIGAGKTALAKIFANELNARLVLEEFAANTYLEKFYQKPDRYAFPLEVSFLVERYQQMNIEFSSTDLFQKTVVSDYLFDKSLIFARHNLSPEHFLLFKRLFDIFSPQVQEPDLTLYLHRPVEEVRSNIEKRGRPFETGMKQSYLEEIEKKYFEYIKHAENSRILIVDLGSADFIEDISVRKSLLWIIKQKHPKTMKIIRL